MNSKQSECEKIWLALLLVKPRNDELIKKTTSPRNF